MLAAHLSRSGQQLLLNCFGAEYMNTAADLVTLNWLHALHVWDNLKRSFAIDL